MDYEGVGYSHWGLYWYNGVLSAQGGEPNNVRGHQPADPP